MDPSASFMTLRTRRPANDGSSMSSADSAYGSVSDGSPAATHDISRVSYHVKHIESFAQALQDSANRAFPNRGRPAQRYSKVHALLLHWKVDDLFVLPELEDLEKCLREHYCFGTDIFAIPSESSHLELMLKVGDMVKQHEAEDTLFIVYYGGHARIDESRQSTWCANRRPGSPWLQWSAIQTLLERSVSDVLILLDCCAGAASATFPTGQSITETISASSWDAIAPDPGRYSFTNALIEVLEEWRQRTFSAAMLHAEILARLKHPRPILINGKQFEARSTPVHFMMTSNHKAPSIEICRLVPNTRLSPSPLGELSYWHRPSDPSMIEARNRIEQYPFPPDDQTLFNSEPNEDEPHVLISLALEGDQQLDFDAWEAWLAEFPGLAKYAKIQGAFKSHSTLLLLSLPVMVWDFLPDDPACSFIAFIRSNNLLQQPKSNSAPLSSQVPASNGASVSETVRDDAESCLSGSTYGPTEHMDIVRRGTSGPSNIHSSAVSAAYQDRSADSGLPPRSGLPARNQLESPSSNLYSSPGPQTQPTAPPSLRNAASTTSLTTLERHQLAPRSLSATASGDLPAPNEGIARTVILNRARSSKKSVYMSDQDVPEGQSMAPHVVRRLEDYFQRDPDPSIAVIEHLASHLGVETSDVHIWFHHRREQERMTLNLQSLRTDSHHHQVRDAPRMILPGHLNRLLEIYPSKGILVVDLRSSTDFERSHIHDAINLRAPLSFVKNTSLEMIEDTFMDDQSRRSFSKWSQYKCIVFYDRVIEFDWECPVAEALFAKFKKKGWHGQCFILKGHYREFSSSFDKYISGSKMTSQGKEYLDSLRQQSSPTQEEASKRDDQYDEWLLAFVGQHRVPTVDLIPARKLERLNAVEQRQKELETEFEARFPALYKKAQAMRPPAVTEEPPSPPPPSPPPPFHTEHPASRPFKDVEWAEPKKDDDSDFELRKAPLVEPFVRGIEKMRAAANMPPAESGSGSPGYLPAEEYPGKSKLDLSADDYEYDYDYDQIDPKSEGLGNEVGFQKACVTTTAADSAIDTAPKGKAGGDTSTGKAAKKRPQIWERLRSAGAR